MRAVIYYDFVVLGVDWLFNEWLVKSLSINH